MTQAPLHGINLADFSMRELDQITKALSQAVDALEACPAMGTTVGEDLRVDVDSFIDKAVKVEAA